MSEMASRPTVLVLDDEKNIRKSIELALDRIVLLCQELGVNVLHLGMDVVEHPADRYTVYPNIRLLWISMLSDPQRNCINT